MKVLKNHSLKQYNTFGLDCKADFFIEVCSLNDIQNVYSNFEFDALPKLILGGGSNVLLYKDFKGLVIKISLVGVKDNGNGLIKVAAGENWHDFVLWSIDKGYNGLENLSLIPGSVGAAPLQNIGAYGVEIKDSFIELEAFHISSKSLRKFSKQDCQFGYRESIFKNSEKGNYIICSVTLQLKDDGLLNSKYGSIQQVLEERCISSPTAKDLSNAVISIRQSKLPDPKIIGNSGSFFKNPIIPLSFFNSIKEKWLDIPSYPVQHNFVKVPAGWLIEKAGWKGKRFSECGVHDKQALVIVNHGSATGKDIFMLAKKIQSSILDMFEIDLQIEVNIIGLPIESN
jgi:UDP-N-acetylmuramate dehydrogenase